MAIRPPWFDHISTNAYWFALTARSQALSPLIIPLLVQRFIGEEAKGTFLGIMRLWALMAAVLMQALMGGLSDRSRSPWGRRRPFVVVGAVGELVVLAVLGFIAGLQARSGYWILFAAYIVSMLASNTAHAAVQALIPDLVPDDKKGLSSGVKTLFELPLPMIFVSLVVGRLVADGDMWGGLAALAAAVVVGAALTLWAPERPFGGPLSPLDWRPLLRLAAMTAAFTGIILGTGAAVSLMVRVAMGLESGLGRLGATILGVGGMLAASVLGVWLSLRVGMGDDIRGNRSFAWWVVNRLLCLTALTNLGQFTIYFLQERFPHLDGWRAAGPGTIVLMFVGLFVLLTVLPSGWLADRVSKKLLLAVAGIVGSVGALAVVIAPRLAIIYGGASIIGAAMGLFYVANWSLGTTLVPKEQAGQFLGLSNLAGAGAGAIGAYIGGPLADRMDYALLMSIYGLLFLLSILPLLGIREGRPKRAP